jgi:pyruvate/2-oxoglutarate dehydrogenase complex dihydrolipoamide acyltransferase (E2) component
MQRRGVRLTQLAFVAGATVRALERHPRLNASIDGEQIVYHDDVNLGIAVALEEGLIVPVIRQAQRLSLEGMAAAITDVAVRAREGRLEPDDVHGGTFTITNPGQFGAVLATPIINQPQVAILDLEAIVKRPVVIDDGAHSDAIAVRPIGCLCMSWDHRALDGADAARFLSTIKRELEGGDAQ